MYECNKIACGRYNFSYLDPYHIFPLPRYCNHPSQLPSYRCTFLFFTQSAFILSQNGEG